MSLPRRALFVLATSFWVLMMLISPVAAQANNSVLVTEATGVISPVLADHLEDAVEQAAANGHDALVVRLDTPGGLVASMRDIVQTFLGAEIPVIVWVAPSGAGAASAGYIITTAAHVAVMAPGTNIGAATPVDMEGGEVNEKVLQDSVSYARELAEHRDRNVTFAEEATRDGRSVGATEALDLGVVDLIAADLDTLLEEADGATVTIGQDDQATVTTADATVVEYEMTTARRILQALADPNLAFIFLSIAPLAIIYDVASGGVGAGLVVGGILLILALFSMQVLPVSFAGVALLLIAIALFVTEAFVPGIGAAAAGGTVALVLSGLFLFPDATGVGVDLAVLIPTAVVAGLASLGVAFVARRTWKSRATTGTEAYVGRMAEVRQADGRAGQVFFDGALWRARSVGGDLHVGDEVRVVDQDGLTLIVDPSAEGAAEDAVDNGEVPGARPMAEQRERTERTRDGRTGTNETREGTP
jgi:membrane-bound serine protease (ClpP class)